VPRTQRRSHPPRIRNYPGNTHLRRRCYCRCCRIRRVFGDTRFCAPFCALLLCASSPSLYLGLSSNESTRSVHDLLFRYANTRNRVYENLRQVTMAKVYIQTNLQLTSYVTITVLHLVPKWRRGLSTRFN
jgi:hypothetical protein